MARETTASNAKLFCPLCKQPNQCTIAAGEKGKNLECWCVDVNFTKEALQRENTTQGPLSCICRECAERINQETTASGSKGDEVQE